MSWCSDSFGLPGPAAKDEVRPASPQSWAQGPVPSRFTLLGQHTVDRAPSAFLLSSVPLLFFSNHGEPRPGPGSGVTHCRGWPSAAWRVLSRAGQVDTGNHEHTLGSSHVGTKSLVETLTQSASLQRALKSSPQRPWAWSKCPGPPGPSSCLLAFRHSPEWKG